MDMFIYDVFILSLQLLLWSRLHLFTGIMRNLQQEDNMEEKDQTFSSRGTLKHLRAASLFFSLQYIKPDVSSETLTVTVKL